MRHRKLAILLPFISLCMLAGQTPSRFPWGSSSWQLQNYKLLPISLSTDTKAAAEARSLLVSFLDKSGGVAAWEKIHSIEITSSSVAASGDAEKKSVFSAHWGEGEVKYRSLNAPVDSGVAAKQTDSDTASARWSHLTKGKASGVLGSDIPQLEATALLSDANTVFTHVSAKECARENCIAIYKRDDAGGLFALKEEWLFDANSGLLTEIAYATGGSGLQWGHRRYSQYQTNLLKGFTIASKIEVGVANHGVRYRQIQAVSASTQNEPLSTVTQ